MKTLFSLSIVFVLIVIASRGKSPEASSLLVGRCNLSEGRGIVTHPSIKWNSVVVYSEFTPDEVPTDKKLSIYRLDDGVVEFIVHDNFGNVYTPSEPMVHFVIHSGQETIGAQITR